jgi:hypothetical protein
VTRLQRFRAQFAPWSGLAAGTVAAGIMHQAGSESVFNDCAVASPVPVLLIGLASFIVVIGAAFVSWRVACSDGEGQSRRLIGFVSVGVSALFLIAIVLPMLASLVLPRCFG